MACVCDRCGNYCACGEIYCEHCLIDKFKEDDKNDAHTTKGNEGVGCGSRIL